jgi:putrescine transport system ATP-binding protein
VSAEGSASTGSVARSERGAVGGVRRSFAPWNDPTIQPLIRYEGVIKRFGDFVAIKKLDLDIYEKEFFSLLGPSGCGKTTLMRMLAGFGEPTEGRILLSGQDISALPPHKRPVNMMFQSYALFPHMDVADNIAFGLKMDGLPKGEISARVDEMLRMVKLEKFAKRKPHQLSGGQRQRVALARSIAKRPKVLLLDEPLGALDKKLREETQFELMDLQQELGMTFIVVTHDQEEAMIMSDRIAVMDNGEIIQIATPAEIYEQPGSRYVADFIGDITIIEGKVESVAGGVVRVSSQATGITHAVLSDQSVNVGQTVWLAVRPEKVSIAFADEAGASHDAFHGVIEDIGYLGKWTTFKVKTDGGLRFSVSQANDKRFVTRPFGWEDKVVLNFAADAAVLLTK